MFFLKKSVTIDMKVGVFVKRIKLLIVLLLCFPLFVSATCTREGDQFRITNPDLGLVDPGSANYNYYCLGIEHCTQKEGRYYDINSGLVSTREAYLASCSCSQKDGKFYDDEGYEVTEQEFNASCKCRVENGHYYNDNNQEITVQEYNQVCLHIGACSIVDGKYYDNNYNEVTEQQYNASCKCREENGHYYNDDNQEITVQQYNQVCLHVGTCSIVNGKYYDNEYNEVTFDEYKADCGCRQEGNTYYGVNGDEVTFDVYNRQCTNPDTGVKSILVISIVSLSMIGIITLILNRKKQIKEL